MLRESMFAPLFKDLYNLVKDKASLGAKLRKINVDNAYLNAANVSKVRTIWQLDKHVDLNSFYYPTKINVDGRIIPVDSLATFPENEKIVIQGAAGQGKSILLRYLTSEALKLGDVLPIFVELRKIDERKSLRELILDNVKGLGLSINSMELDSLLATGKCTLILDAFDEIPEPEVKRTITELESLCHQHNNLQVVISSRPNSEVQKIPCMRVLEMSELLQSDFEPLLHKLFDGDSVQTQEMLRAISHSDIRVSQVITTPLLLTIIFIIYRSINNIPKDLTDFYKKLFEILSFRHDSTKPGFKRELSSKLSESEFSKVFNVFCFLCMKDNLLSIDYNKAVKISSNAARLVDIKLTSPENFLRDINKITCLLLDEGFEYHFIHKSIREYHSALFIKEHATNKLKLSFYSYAINQHRSYLQELKFLSVIDEISFKKHFLIPHISNILAKSGFTSSYEKFNPNWDFILSGVEMSFSNGKMFRLNHSPLSYIDDEVDISSKMSYLFMKETHGFLFFKSLEGKDDVIKLDKRIVNTLPQSEIESMSMLSGTMPLLQLRVLFEKEKNFSRFFNREANQLYEKKLREERYVREYEDNFNSLEF